MRVLALIVSIFATSAIVSLSDQPVSADTQANRERSNTAELNEVELASLFSSEKSTVLKELIETDDSSESGDEARDDNESHEPEPKIHTVTKGENLTKIAEEYDTVWIRIWQKNTDLDHPDKLSVKQELVIPDEDEELDDRPLPQPEPEPASDSREPAASARGGNSNDARQSTQNASAARQQVQRGSSSGNTYTPGYCTWYVKNRRPDLPNNLGNANTWYARASAQGLATGAAPRAGAVAATTQGAYGHVAYVESVNNDGTVTVSEMNWNGLYVTSTRTVPASSFVYIY